MYSFAERQGQGSSAMRTLLGGKGCELAEMTKMGAPVPPGFTITTEAWAAYDTAGKKHPAGLWTQVMAHLARLEAAAGSRLGDPTRPLLVSVRSPARASMPGMMDTVLNLGLNDKSVEGLAARTRNERFAWDCYRRFITLFGDVVLCHRSARPGRAPRGREDARGRQDGCRPSARGSARAGRGAEEGRARQDGPAVPARSARAAPPGDPRGLRVLVDEKGGGLPPHPRVPDDWGTAVTVMAMVFGNRGPTSGTGVCLSPRTTAASGASSANSRERPGRRRRGRHPDPRADRGPQDPNARGVRGSSRRSRRSSTITGTCRTSSSRRRRGPLHPADALREADGPRRGADRGGDARGRGPHRSRPRAAPDRKWDRPPRYWCST